jgi:hypothetical protein
VGACELAALVFVFRCHAFSCPGHGNGVMVLLFAPFFIFVFGRAAMVSIGT